MTFEKKNTAASACRRWLEIVLFRILTSTRMRSPLKPITIRAAVGRDEKGAPLIKGVARHPLIAGKVRFSFDGGITDLPMYRAVSETVGNGEVEYIGRRIRFMLELSGDDTLWVRILDAQGKPSPIRYGMGRGKMRPPLSETRR